MDFEYYELPTPRSIRLLTIDYCDSDGTLHCSLGTALLDDLPEFIALSYAWGDGEATKSISINGCQFNVKPNLHNFLMTVASRRLCGESLFVDAICINQCDKAEKQSQIPLMRDIYGNASKVIAWLGPADGLLSKDFSDCKNALAGLKDLDLKPKIASEIAAPIGQELQRYRHLLQETQALFDGAAGTQANQADVSGVENVVSDTAVTSDLWLDLNNPGGFGYSHENRFWKRVWIVQEVILAKDLIIQVGEFSISPQAYLSSVRPRWKPFFMSNDRNSGKPTGSRDDFIERLLRKRDDWRKRAFEERGIPLHEVLLHFGYQAASEPLDQVFGFLGLAQTKIRPDYSLSRIELYIYMLIEGAQHIKRPRYSQKDLDALQTFHYACLSALRLSPVDANIALLTDQAFQLCSVPEIIRAGVNMQASLTARFKAAVSSTDRTWIVVVKALVLGAICYSDYFRMCIYWEYLQFFNRDIAVPKEEVRSFAAWMVFVAQQSILVESGLPPGHSILLTGPGSIPERAQRTSSKRSRFVVMTVLIISWVMMKRLL